MTCTVLSVYTYNGRVDEERGEEQAGRGTSLKCLMSSRVPLSLSSFPQKVHRASIPKRALLGRPLTMVFAAGASRCGLDAVAVPSTVPNQPPGEPDMPQINVAGSAVQQTVEVLYRRYNPEKIPDVPKLIEKYGEDGLLKMVRKKYAKNEKRRKQDLAALEQ